MGMAGTADSSTPPSPARAVRKSRSRSSSMKHAITKATRQWCASEATRCIGGDVTARKWTHAMAGGRPVISR